MLRQKQKKNQKLARCNLLPKTEREGKKNENSHDPMVEKP